MMDNKYNGYCMKFSNKELKDYLISEIERKTMSKVRILSEDAEEIDVDSDEKIDMIVFDGEDENLYISFYGVHTSIFVFDKEIMFIDENSKGIYTSSDVYDNVVYEGKLRKMSHLEMLQMFAELILCFMESNAIEVIVDDDKEKKYEEYSYYKPHIFTIIVDNGRSIKQEKVFDNITIKY